MFVIPVAVYENLFLLKGIVEYVLEHLGVEGRAELLIKLEQCVKKAAEDTKFHKKLPIDHIGRQFKEKLGSFEPASAENPVFQFEFDGQVYRDSVDGFESQPYSEVLKQYNQKSSKQCAGSLGYTWDQWYEQVLNIFNTEKRMISSSYFSRMACQT